MRFRIEVATKVGVWLVWGWVDGSDIHEGLDQARKNVLKWDEHVDNFRLKVDEHMDNGFQW